MTGKNRWGLLILISVSYVIYWRKGQSIESRPNGGQVLNEWRTDLSFNQAVKKAKGSKKTILAVIS